MTKKGTSSFYRSLLALLIVMLASMGGVNVTHGQTESITKVLIVQSLGNQADKYVAGKDTAVLVYMDQPTTVAPDQQKVEVKLGAEGATVATLKPSPANGPVRVLIFQCPSSAGCGGWKAGDYTFVATIGGATAEAKATLQERKGLKVLAVPVKANYGPGDVRSTTGKWRNMGEFVRAIYPLAPDRFEVTFGQEVDASADKYNLKTEQGQAEMFGEVAKLQPNDCFRTPRPDNVQGCYDKVVAFVKDRMGADGTLQGFTMGFGTNIVVESDEDAAATVAHEIGHNYGLGDEYAGGQFNCEINPPPPSFVGADFNQREAAPFSCQKSASGQFEQTSASIIRADIDVPFEVGGRGLLPDMASFMGSGAPQDRNWISAPAWSRIFDGLAPDQNAPVPGATAFSDATATPENTTVPDDTVVPENREATRWIYAQGYIGRDDAVTVGPWYSYQSDEPASQESSNSEYMLQALDGADQVLVSIPLEVNFTVIDNPQQLDEAFFAEVMPFPEGTSNFQILKRDQSLADMPVSANAPTVNILSPTSGETLQGDNYTVKWEGVDADNDPLLYDVEYSPDGEEWYLVDSELETTQTVLDLSELPGSDKPVSLIRVTATDGINAAESVSEPFSIEPKAPEAYIDTPQEEVTYEEGSEVILEGIGFDLQDYELTDVNQLSWSSDIQGELGTGDLLVLYDLKPGKHTITLTATNSFNMSANHSVVVNIVQSQETQPTTAVEATTAAEQLASPTAVGAGSEQIPATSTDDGGSPLILILLGVVVAVVLVVGVVLMSRRRTQPPVS